MRSNVFALLFAAMVLVGHAAPPVILDGPTHPVEPKPRR